MNFFYRKIEQLATMNVYILQVGLNPGIYANINLCDELMPPRHRQVR